MSAPELVEIVECQECGVLDPLLGDKTLGDLQTEGWDLDDGDRPCEPIDYCPPCSRKQGLHEDPDEGRDE